MERFLSEKIKYLNSEDKGKPGRLAFMARSMVMATLPHSKLDQLVFQRKNGYYTLTMMANPQFGLPYGSIPRMILAWLTTEAIGKKSPEINLGKSFASFLKKIELQNGGGKRGNSTRVREQMMRLLTCSISCIYLDKNKGICEGEQYNISHSFKLWWSPLETGRKEFLSTSNIMLARDFFDELIKSPIPIDLEALNLLRQSPLQIDIYIWLTYRFSFLKEETFIPWALLKNQFGSDYADDAQGTRNFKKKFLQALKKVWLVYPTANVCPIDKGLMLYKSDTHVKKKTG
ncbi:MAG: replication protein RepA [Gammaproteobacteria bacterium]